MRLLTVLVFSLALLSINGCSNILSNLQGARGPAGTNASLVPVTEITINTSPTPNLTAISYNAIDLGFTATITPSTATNVSLTWSVVDATTGLPAIYAVMESNGVLYFNTPSISTYGETVIVTATANDGSGVVSNSYQIQIQAG